MGWKKWLLDPRYTTKLHGWAAFVWLVVGTPVTLLWLSNSVAFVAWMSLYAIVVAHWSTFQASHAEKKIREDR